MRGGGGVQLGACVGAVCEGAASGRAGFDAVGDDAAIGQCASGVVQ
jgi:hypothetical protein